MHVTLAKPDAGVETQPLPGMQASTVQASPSSHAEGPHEAVGGSVVLGGDDVVVLEVVVDRRVVVVDG